MKIYVAGKWEDWERVRRVQDALKERGHTITHDWTREAVSEHPREKAILDVRAASEADAVVAVLEQDLQYRGTYVEIGVALGKGVPVYSLGQNMHDKDIPADRSEWHLVFAWHPLWRDFGAFPDGWEIWQELNLGKMPLVNFGG
jgi:nucleoside 2-deoxyribosyltransferase